MEKRKIVVLITALLAFCLFLSFYLFKYFQEEKTIVVDTKRFPTIGSASAKVELVVIEDFRCHSCAQFSEVIFPRILSEYVNTGKVRYSIVAVAFLPGSKSIASAALEVYQLAPDRFLPYVHEIFLTAPEKPMTDADLLACAEKVGGIDTQRLAECLKTNCRFKDLDENLQWVKETLGNNYGTPSLYINGEPTSTASFAVIKEKIDKAL